MRCNVVSRFAIATVAVFMVACFTAVPADARGCKRSWANEHCQTAKTKKFAQKTSVGRHAMANRHSHSYRVRKTSRRSCNRNFSAKSYGWAATRSGRTSYGYSSGYSGAGSLAQRLERDNRFGHAN